MYLVYCFDITAKCNNHLKTVAASQAYINQFKNLNDDSFLTQYCADDKIDKNEMDWARGVYG